MKKMFFLLLIAVAFVGLMPAAEAVYHPPWGISLEAELSEYGVFCNAVNSGTVLAKVQLIAVSVVRVDSYGVQINNAYNEAAMGDSIGMTISNEIDFPLRL